MHVYKEMNTYHFGDAHSDTSDSALKYSESEYTHRINLSINYITCCGRNAPVLCAESVQELALYANVNKESSSRSPLTQDHWEVLLRARAIETQCYVVAAAQTGKHNASRESFGHAMVRMCSGSRVVYHVRYLIADKIGRNVCISSLWMDIVWLYGTGTGISSTPYPTTPSASRSVVLF